MWRIWCSPPTAVGKGIAALREGCDIVTDTQMAKAGINKTILGRLGGEVHCFMSDPDVAAEAKERGVTPGHRVHGAGGAAFQALRVCHRQRPHGPDFPARTHGSRELDPALIIGVPVGFVNVVESKELFLDSPVPHIIARGRKGGSNVAARHLQRHALPNHALMEQYIEKDGKRLRLGYTTGSCAAAAAKAAAWMLLTGREKTNITLDTPKGIRLDLPVLEITRTAEQVSCAIEKDGGDDPDITKGTLIFATVTRSEGSGVDIDGGIGIGRVTKRGLDQPVGNAAINSVPRKMIRENVEEVMALADYKGGLKVVISAPEGEILAQKTFNPRLGIVGGISILGTTGIVEPMSEKALVDTIRVELRQRGPPGKNTPC